MTLRVDRWGRDGLDWFSKHFHCLSLPSAQEYLLFSPVGFNWNLPVLDLCVKVFKVGGSDC